jgi:hypothetical protein
MSGGGSGPVSIKYIQYMRIFCVLPRGYIQLSGVTAGEAKTKLHRIKYVHCVKTGVAATLREIMGVAAKYEERRGVAASKERGVQTRELRCKSEDDGVSAKM